MFKISMKKTFRQDRNAKLTISCPKCGHQGQYLLAQLEHDKTLTCSGCGVSGPITGNLFETLRNLRSKFADK